MRIFLHKWHRLTHTYLNISATAGFTIISAALVLSSSHVPAYYGNVSISVSAFLSNAMTTRVYRKLKLGLIRDDAQSSADSSHALHSIMVRGEHGRSQRPLPTSTTPQFEIQVNITEDTTVDDGRGRPGLPVTIDLSDIPEHKETESTDKASDLIV